MSSNIFKFCLCRHDRDQFVKGWQQKPMKSVESFSPCACRPYCPYSSHNAELWRKSSRCPEMAKRKVLICFLIAEKVLLVCSTFKISPHTDNLVNQGRKCHLNLIYLTKKANTSKGSRKKNGAVFFTCRRNLMGHMCCYQIDWLIDWLIFASVLL